MMKSPFNNSFEEQLKQRSEKFEIQPSSRVWEGVQGALEEDAVVFGSNSTAKVASIFMKNWILNLLVPAVVLVGSGSFFYLNYQKNNTANNIGETSNKNSATNNATEVKQNTVAISNNETVANNNTIDNEKVSSSNKDNVATSKLNNENFDAANVSGNSTSIANLNRNNKLKDYSSFGMLNAKRNADFAKNTSGDENEEINSKSGAAIFSKSDLQKISKKEIEKDNPNDLKERNLKSADFN